MERRSLLYYFLLLFLIVHQYVFAQTNRQGTDIDPVALTPQQLYTLSTLPPVSVPEKYKGANPPVLPWWIDNSTQPYFRPITNQVGFECGQSAGISFNFTYEVDRLRNVAADTTTTQYPSLFTWDFLNNGEKYVGASCFDSWEILRACGNMNVADYGGGLATGGLLRWISGYDNYYNGMFNRINFMRSIRVDSPEGLQTLKYWLTDHLEGSKVGGVANLYGKYFYPTIGLPAGTPEEGKWVQPQWGPAASHTFTVAGFNDSICYDYNGDGKYTNNLDINNDGIVDMHDWEVGGLKLASGYEGLGWSNQGFIYTMYKCLADDLGFGGIWNHSVYVIDTKKTCVPQLTAKIVLKHTSRNKLKVTMGISTDLQASVPSYILEFPIFNFQGGDHYMQGDSTEAAKTIEFGLDLAPLVNQLNNGQPAQFFLQVEEKDPEGVSDGEITSYSLMDYTSGSVVTINCPDTNVPIANDTITRLRISHSVMVQRPEISTDTLPEAGLYQPFNYQLTASGGSAPYIWDARLEYSETIATDTFPDFNGQKLELTNNNSGYSIVSLPFDFPFYQRSVHKIYVYADGYILFDDEPFYWPYLIDKMLLFKYTSVISPFMSDLNLYPNQSDGIWYETDTSSITIKWKASINGMQGGSNLNFAVKLFKEGKIEFYYGIMNFPGNGSWIGGISGGDNQNFRFSLLNNSTVVPANTLDRFNSCGFPQGMKITEDGLFTGVPVSSCQNRPVTLRVTDNNNISAIKTLLFSTHGLLVNYSVHSGNDSIIQYGDTVSINLVITNTDGQAVHNISTALTGANPYLTINDSTELTGDLGPFQTTTITGAFSFTVSPVVPDNYELPFILNLSSNEHNFQQAINLVSHSPKITIDNLTLADGDNGRLDPGETTDMIVTFKNSGGAESINTKVVFSSLDSCLIINTQDGSLGILKPDSVKSAVFNITATGKAPFEHLYTLKDIITADNGFTANDTNYLFSGDFIEDFESGSFNKFEWSRGGDGLFYADSLEHHEGHFCTRSGWLYDGQTSVLAMNVKVLRNGKISFYRRVSCEHDPGGSCTFDYLAFYIDDKEMGKWDGWIDWTLQSFDVTQGYHTFRWMYHKDISNSWGSDCAWIDFITFPPINKASPVTGVTPLFFSKEVEKEKAAVDTLFITNTGNGILDFSIAVFDTSAVPKNGREAFDFVGSPFRCLSNGFIPGQPFSWKFILVNPENVDQSIKQVKMDLPYGVKVNEATDFSGGSLGDLVYQEQGSDSSTIMWQGVTPGGTGVIRPGDTAIAIVSGFTDVPFINDIFLVYSIHSDSTGGDPRNLTGHIKLNNRSLPNSWLTLGLHQGSLFRGETDTLFVKMDAHGLSSGFYHCNIILKDGFNNNMVVPVTMHVIDSNSHLIPNDDGNLLITGYPNPFSQVVNIEYETKKEGEVQAWVFDIYGKRIKTLISESLPAGRYRLIWDRKNDNGDWVSSGIYYCTMKAGDKSATLKLILIR